jgi:putative DNA primase/helicase
VIRPAPRRRAARATSEHAARTERPITAAREPGATQDGEGADAERQHAVPEAVRRHFVQVENKFYFQDGALAFTDRQHKLTTRSENTQLIADLVSVAKARGWERIAVSGTERFRREAWMAAQHEGLAVSGYKPSQFEQARWVRRAARQHDVGEPGEAAQRAAPRAHVIRSTDHARVVSGRLADHGAATYQHDPHEPMSYFVRIETAKGEQTVWGVDLERALRESLSQPKNGDEVVLRAVGRDAVTVKRPAGSDGVAEKTAHRNRWSIETKAFLNERQRIAAVLRDASIPAVQGARQQPELVGAYMQVRAAELAAQQFRERSERERFVAMVRSALADAVARGEVLPKTQLRAEAKPIDRTERFRMERER